MSPLHKRNKGAQNKGSRCAVEQKSQTQLDPLIRFMRRLFCQDATEEIADHLFIPDNHALSSTGNHYGDVFMSGSSRAHFGDFILSIHGTATPQQHEIRSLIRNAYSPSASDLAESSSNFRPDSYTQESQELTLFNYSGDEVARTDSSHSFLFNMLYRDSNAVSHIALSLEVEISSKFWGRIPPDSESRLSNSSMPTELLIEIKKWLSENKANRHSLFLRGVLTNELELKIPVKSRDQAFELRSMCRSRLLAFSNDVKHWDCRPYPEHCLHRQSMFIGYRSYYSLVFLPDRKHWAREIRICPNYIAFQSQIYTLRVMHCLRLARCFGIPRLFGHVRDSADCVVAFLTDLPAKESLSDIMQKGNCMGQPVDRKRREKWCRQLLHTVAAVHRQTFVVGMFGLRLARMLAVDANDNVTLSALFRPMMLDCHEYPGVVPPEYRNAKQPVRMTPQIDMFQLGLILWRIAGNKVSDGCAAFCQSFGCQTSSDLLCSEPHANPIALTMAPDEYDDGLKTIIEICRSENPSDRKPVVDLLDLFPGPIYSHQDTYGAHGPDNNFDIQEYQRMYGNCTTCSNCSQICTDHNFHCSICKNDDFDICKPCFKKGLHCYNNEHFLYERQGEAPETKRWSSLRDNGQREFFEL